MGGTVIRLAQQGHNVLLVDATNGEPTPHGSPQQREVEWTQASRVMGGEGPPIARRLLGLPNRTVQHTVEARHAMAGVIREHQADILFTPYEQDAHPDHRAVTRIVEDARFDAKLTRIDLPGEPCYPKYLIYYYATHLRWVADPTFLIDISAQIDRKIDAINAYQTQFVIPEKNRRVVEWVRQFNGYMGSRIGTAYAEPFFSKEPLGLAGLSDVVL